MTSKTIKTLFNSLLLMAAMPAALTGSLVLYTAPDTGSEQLGSSLAESSDLMAVRPVEAPGLATQGWFSAEYRSMITGFVSDAEIGKDLLPVEAAPILESPAAGAAVLANYQEGQEIEILDRGLYWKVRIAMIVPVYYQVKAPPAAEDEVTGAGESGDQPGIGQVALEESPTFDSQSQQAGQGQLRAVTRPGSRLAPTALRSQPFEGTFKQARGALGIRRPPFPYMLEDSAGRRIAWIDPAQMTFTESFPDFIDRRVVIFGEWNTDLAPRDRVITGQNMRLAPAP